MKQRIFRKKRSRFVDVTEGLRRTVLLGFVWLLLLGVRAASPTLSSVADVKISVGATSSEIPIVIGDAETPVLDLELTATSTDEQLVSQSGLTLGGNGANRTLIITPTAGKVGRLGVVLNVNDGDGNEIQHRISVLVGESFHGLKRDVYLNLSQESPGSTWFPNATIEQMLSDQRYPAAPDISGSIAYFELPSDFGDNYGNRIYGYVHPPVSGDYTFYISSDDRGLLYLSTDESPSRKVLVASEPNWTGWRWWVNGPNATSRGIPPVNKSAPIRLEAGRAYYVEMLQTDLGGGASGGVTWRVPGAAEVGDGDAPIQGVHLSFMAPTVSAEVTIPDPQLERVLRQTIGKATGPITQTEMEGIFHLNLNNSGVRSLEGLQVAKNLADIDMAGNSIADLSPLSGLTNIFRINAGFNEALRSLEALQELRQLATLDIGRTSVRDLRLLTND